MAQKKKTKSAKSKPAKKATASKASKAKDIKYVYDFGKKTDGDAKQRELLGGKGANLAEMARIGLPVPPGFTITTEVCTHYYANKIKPHLRRRTTRQRVHRQAQRASAPPTGRGHRARRRSPCAALRTGLQ